MFLGIYIESVVFLGTFIESVVFLGLYIETVVFLRFYVEPVVFLRFYTETVVFFTVMTTYVPPEWKDGYMWDDKLAQAIVIMTSFGWRRMMGMAVTGALQFSRRTHACS